MSYTVTELQQALTRAQQIYVEVASIYPCEPCNGTGEVYYKTSRRTPWVENGPFTCKECGGRCVVVVTCEDANDENGEIGRLVNHVPAQVFCKLNIQLTKDVEVHL
jgi:hypothetical protein